MGGGPTGRNPRPARRDRSLSERGGASAANRRRTIGREGRRRGSANGSGGSRAIDRRKGWVVRQRPILLARQRSGEWTLRAQVSALYDEHGQRQRHNQVMEFQTSFSGKVQRPMAISNPNVRKRLSGPTSYDSRRPLTRTRNLATARHRAAPFGWLIAPDSRLLG